MFPFLTMMVKNSYVSVLQAVYQNALLALLEILLQVNVYVWNLPKSICWHSYLRTCSGWIAVLSILEKWLLIYHSWYYLSFCIHLREIKLAWLITILNYTLVYVPLLHSSQNKIKEFILKYKLHLNTWCTSVIKVYMHM